MSSMLIIVIGVFLAAFIQGMTGVGFSMIVMALLPFITSFTQSAQIALILTIFFGSIPFFVGLKTGISKKVYCFD